MKRCFFIFVLIACLCLTFVACSHGAGSPEWLPEEAAEQKMQQFTMTYAADGSVVWVSYCVPESSVSALRYSYRPGEPLEQSIEERPTKKTALAMKDLPGIAEALKDWTLENEPEAEITLSYLLPEYSFLEDTEYPEKKLSISLTNCEVRPLEEEYAGSREYGAISISVGNSIQYMVYIDV